MTDPTDRVRAALGIPPSIGLRATHHTLEDPAVAEGSSAALAGVVALATLISSYEKAPAPRRVELDAPLPNQVSVSYDQRERGLFVVADEAGVVTPEQDTEAERREGLLYVKAPAVVRLPGVALVFDIGTVTRVELPQGLDLAEEQVAGAAPDVLLTDWTCVPDLEAEVRGLAESPAVVDKASAAGLLGRLWEPTEDPEGARTAMREGKPSPTQRVKAWALKLSPLAAEELAAQALDESNALYERLERLETAITEDPKRAVLAATAFTLARDRLESLAFVVRSSGVPSTVPAALAQLDREVTARASMFAFLPPLKLPAYLRAVAWQEPLNWWGELAAGAGDVA